MIPDVNTQKEVLFIDIYKQAKHPISYPFLLRLQFACALDPVTQTISKPFAPSPNGTTYDTPGRIPTTSAAGFFSE